MDFTFSFIKLFFVAVFYTMPLFLLLGIVIIVLGQIVTHIEKWSWFNGLYWSFVTATTLGYGDIHPLRKVSKTLSIFIAFIGVMFTGLLIAITVKVASVSFERHVGSYLVIKNKIEPVNAKK